MPTITDFKSEHGNHLQNLTPACRALVRQILLTFLQAPGADIYDVVEQQDPSAVLGEQLAWVLIPLVSLEPPATIRKFAKAIAS